MTQGAPPCQINIKELELTQGSDSFSFAILFQGASLCQLLYKNFLSFSVSCPNNVYSPLKNRLSFSIQIIDMTDFCIFIIIHTLYTCRRIVTNVKKIFPPICLLVNSNTSFRYIQSTLLFINISKSIRTINKRWVGIHRYQC